VEEERQTMVQKWAAPGAVEQQRVEQLVLLRVEQLGGGNAITCAEVDVQVDFGLESCTLECGGEDVIRSSRLPSSASSKPW
jgi:hypothetical protein